MKNKLATVKHYECVSVILHKDFFKDDRHFKLEIAEFINSTHPKQQMEAVKKISVLLPQQKTDHIENVIQFLCAAYISSGPKNPIKRALSSCLGTCAQHHSADIVIKQLCKSYHQLVCLDHGKDVLLWRKGVDAVTALLENFPLGEKCMTLLWFDCIKLLSNGLDVFLQVLRDTEQSADSKLQTFHHCLSTIQVLTKVFSKMNLEIEQVLLPSDKVQIVTKSVLEKQLVTLSSQLYLVLTDELFSLDMRAACGMCIILCMKTINGKSAAHLICDMLFSTRDNSHSTAISDVVDNADPFYKQLSTLDSHVGRLCIYGALLAYLDILDLMAQPTPDKRDVLSDAIPRELLALITKFTSNTSALLYTLKTISLWTSRACEAISGESTLMCARLCGDSPLMRDVLECAVTHCHHPIDAIRHQAKSIFNGVLQCHMSIMEALPQPGNFLPTLISQLLALPDDQSSRYTLLSVLVQHHEAAVLLNQHPGLEMSLINAAREQSIAPHICELYMNLCTKDIVMFGDVAYKRWMSPIISILCSGEKFHKQNLLEYILPKLFKSRVDCLSYIIKMLTADMTASHNIGALISCLRQAQSLQILRNLPAIIKDTKEPMWGGVLPLKYIKIALCHTDDKLRLHTLSLLCEHPKTTDVITNEDLQAVKFFLTYNLKNQISSFRQVLIAAIKKLLQRIKDSSYVLGKTLSNGRKSETERSDSKNTLQSYQTFLSDLLKLIFDHLHPEAAFSSRTSSLELLNALLTAFSTNGPYQQSIKPDGEILTDINNLQIDDAKSFEDHLFGGLLLSDANSDPSPLVLPYRGLYLNMTAYHAQSLLQCITDTFEHNKMQAHAALLHMSAGCLPHQSKFGVHELFEGILHLVCSTRPQDCNTAAYLLQIYTETPNAQQDMIQFVIDNNINVQENSHPALLVLHILLHELLQQVSVAQTSLLHAASTKPMYPVLHCIRYTLQNIKLKSIELTPAWITLFSQIINVCFTVAHIVSPVVTNSSPEGNVPIGQLGYLGPGLELDAVLTEQSDLTQFNEHNANKDVPSTKSAESADYAVSSQDLARSETRVSLMPEYLLVCCWRSIKEVSLLLAHVVSQAPISSNQADHELTGLINVEQVNTVGSYFVKQLLESCHRGAFELAYAGFVIVADTLWRSDIIELKERPSDWLREVMLDIESCDPNNRLCATRRSAGTPFYIQALVSTEPIISGRQQFKSIMTRLLQLAIPSQTLPSESTTDEPDMDYDRPRIHSLNILRALFRDTRLSDDVMPYVAGGIQAAIVGYTSEKWAIRNSATLLYSALMTRTFGVQRSKDETAKKNRMTGRVFFNRFPTLFPFLLDQLQNAQHSISDDGQYRLNPGLYPVLMILGRLYPSTLDLTTSDLNLSAFVPHVIRCAHSAVYKIRIMSGRAISPLVTKDQLIATTEQLINLLPLNNTEQYQHNTLHGVLIQLCYLLEEMPELQTDQQQTACNMFLNALYKRFWLARSGCFVTQSAYLKLLVYLLNTNWANVVTAPHMVVLTDLMSQIVNLAQDTFLNSRHSVWNEPGQAEFYTSLVSHTLTVMCRVEHIDQHILNDIVCGMLGSPYYQIRQVALSHLLSIHHDNVAKSTFDNIVQSPNLMDRCVQNLFDYNFEGYAECLAKTLEFLSKHPQTMLRTWTKQGIELNIEQVCSYVLASASESTREDVRCAAIGLCITVFNGIARMGDVLSSQTLHDLLKQWCHLLSESCTTRITEPIRIKTAEAVVSLKKMVCFMDGSLQTAYWRCVMIAMQDESEDVRDVITGILGGADVSEEYQGYVLDGCFLQSTLALHVALDMMYQMYWPADSPGYVQTMVKWILMDLELDWTAKNDGDVRLFDRGEMNTYLDAVQFVRAVSSQLCTAIQNIGDNPGTYTTHTTTSGTAPSQKIEVVDQILEHIRRAVESCVGGSVGKAEKEYTLASTFTDSASYNSAVLECWRRHRLSLVREQLRTDI